MSVHCSKKTKAALEELRILPIYNAPYACDFNPAEGVISVGKRKVKQARLQAIVTKTKIDLQKVIVDSFEEIEKNVC